jgi:hypothetical protein
MRYDLTEAQKALVRWIAKKIESGELDETFYVTWIKGGGIIQRHGKILETPSNAKVKTGSAGVTAQSRASRNGSAKIQDQLHGNGNARTCCKGGLC